MNTDKIYTSDDILQMDDLYELQDSFSSSGCSFKYQLTDGELGWLDFVKGRYCIADYILKNMDGDGVMTFTDPFELSQALKDDDCTDKAVMLSDDTALQKLFFWLSIADQLEPEKVVIEKFGRKYSVYNEAGQAIEHNFTSRKKAKEWAEDNDYEIVDNFNSER